MTQVDFHVGVEDPLHYTCRLLRKACRQGARLAVTAPPPVLQALDRELWIFEAREFVPHLRVSGTRPPPQAAARHTPVWLVDGPWPDGAPDLLVNLGAEPPQDCSRLSRVIEIVADDAQQLERGRERWRHYQRQGLAPRRVNEPGTGG